VTSKFSPLGLQVPEINFNGYFKTLKMLQASQKDHKVFSENQNIRGFFENCSLRIY
jgi:hypothetical protein